MVNKFWDTWKTEIMSFLQANRENQSSGEQNSIEREYDNEIVPTITADQPTRNINFNLYTNIPVQVQKMTAKQFSAFTFADLCVQRSGKVVAILKMGMSNYAGKLKIENGSFTFMPLNTKYPRARVLMRTVPKEAVDNPHRYQSCIYLASFERWNIDSAMPLVRIDSMLGEAGDLTIETNVLLLENNVDYSDFPPSITQHLPQLSETQDLVISEKELAKRVDLRGECVFTIDPETARDLDDALSIKAIGFIDKTNKELFEVGVHIADVSHWVHLNDPIDLIAQKRTTSFYCVQKVIPMLPHLLCNTICSLNPNEDKLTFSAFFHIDIDGHVHKTWFAKTVIRSCIKLSYDMALDLKNRPDDDWETKGNMPKVYGAHSYRKIAQTIEMLDRLAVVLRRQRFANGAIQFEKVAVKFVMDEKNEVPLGYMNAGYKLGYLVEEFMLLANIAVAEKLHNHSPEASVLRRHDRPSDRSLVDFQETCRKIDFDFNISSSKEMQRSLNRLRDEMPVEVSQAISFRLLRSMKQAKYFVGPNQNTHHFGLGIPLYTHFTSPIRRYPDILVHRQLAAVLKLHKAPAFNLEATTELIERCNEAKMASLAISDGSVKLFFAMYMSRLGSIEQDTIVLNVLDQSFECFMISIGFTVMVYLDQLDLQSFQFEGKRSILRLKFNDTSKSDREIKLYQRIKVKVSVPDATQLLKWKTILAD